MTRADCYQALAEALAPDGPPAWLAGPGREWPLFDVVVRLAAQSGAARRAGAALAAIPAESLAARRRRHVALFAGAGRPRFWLHESAFRSGRILGPETFAVEKRYRLAGVQPAGGELPDHAALELAFLARLARGASAAPEEKHFIRRHAGRWLPALGRGLARSGDEVYAPIGQLLADWLDEALAPVSRRSREIRRLPLLPRSDACTLCGFCAQVCPPRALAVRETATHTTLALNAAACLACGACVQVCETRALVLDQTSQPAVPGQVWLPLRQSPRAQCPACGQPTVSRAELDFVAARIGRPRWLDYCLDCRPRCMEGQR